MIKHPVFEQDAHRRRHRCRVGGSGHHLRFVRFRLRPLQRSLQRRPLREPRLRPEHRNDGPRDYARREYRDYGRRDFDRRDYGRRDFDRRPQYVETRKKDKTGRNIAIGIGAFMLGAIPRVRGLASLIGVSRTRAFPLATQHRLRGSFLRTSRRLTKIYGSISTVRPHSPVIFGQRLAHALRYP